MKEKEFDKKEKQGKIWPVVLCLLLAGGVFLLLLNVEARQLASYEKGNVVVAISDVTEAKEITEENLAELFAVVERPLSDIPEAAYYEMDKLIGQYVQSGIDAGSMVTKSVLGDLNKIADESVLVEKALEKVTVDRSYTSSSAAIRKEDDRGSTDR